jgi:hypothetical protein
MVYVCVCVCERKCVCMCPVTFAGAMVHTTVCIIILVCTHRNLRVADIGTNSRTKRLTNALILS